MYQLTLIEVPSPGWPAGLGGSCCNLSYLHLLPSSGSPKALTSITESASFTPITSNHILFLASGKTLFLQCFFNLDLFSINLAQFAWVTGLEREHWVIMLDSTKPCAFMNSFTSGCFHSTNGEKQLRKKWSASAAISGEFKVQIQSPGCYRNSA